MTKRMTRIESRIHMLVGNLTLVGAFVAAGYGLMEFNASAPGPSGARANNVPPGSGVVVHSELIQLWLPETLLVLARDAFPRPVAETTEELKSALGRGGQENLWYAMTIRGHQANHGASDISFIRFPCRESEHLRELNEVLATVSRSSLDPTSQDDPAAIVRIIPEGMSQQEWMSQYIDQHSPVVE